MSTCVNLSLKEFKDCCERLNVSATTLEPIVHEYINTVGGENSFPTDTYIERVIHGSEQPVLSEEQVTLWEKRYSQPAQFDDVLEAMSYITEAERFFPRESIGLKETLDGKVEVRVTKPIYVGPNTSLEEFAREQERQEQEWREVQQRDAIEAEKLLIKQKSIADGTFMLAPNGKPSNLTEDQWLSVRTKAFKEWFGDWENNSENASKVVDENDEPKVVWRASRYGKKTDYNIFELEKTGGQGFYFANKEAAEKWYGGDNMRSFFLNLRNPDTSNNFNVLQSEVRYFDENDGIIFAPKGTEDITFEVKVFNPNQIKSAEFNIGYSKTDNNIYHNKNLKDRYDKLLEYVEENINEPWFSLKDFNHHWGTNFGFNPKTKEITTRDERIHGVSVWNLNDTKVEAKKKIDRLQLLNYLSSKFGLKFEEISNSEYEKKAGSLSNCCVIGDTVYIRKGDKNKLTNEQLIEEFLHPLVNAIYKSNPELSNKLLEEAKKLFPDLTKQIAVAYADQSKQVQEEELITQVLSKYLNKEISDKGTNTRTIADYIKQFFESILDLVKDLFGDIRIEKDTRLKVSGKDIKTVFSFKSLAELINSKEITFTDTLNADEWRNNRNVSLTLKQQTVVNIVEQSDSTSNSYDEIFTPQQPVQKEIIIEEEKEIIEDEVEQQFDDYQKKIEKAVKEAEEFIATNNAFSEQVENLINSTEVNQSEITEFANEVSYLMSDLITQWQDNPKTFFENFPSKKKETEEESIKWFNSLSRKQILESIGIGNFLTIVKDRLFNDLNYDNLTDEEIDALDTKAMLFSDNFDALLRFGMSAFRSIEDFNINYSETGYKVEKIEDTDNTAEGYEFDNEELDFIEELGDKQEHWQIDSRTIDNFLSMSQIVKRELTRCYLTEKDADGNVINKTNSFGVNKRVDPKNATANILRWTQGAITLDQMISKLKEKEEANPWLTQIISKLEDRSGKYTDFQSQFFTVFCKHFQEYYYILETKDEQGNRVMSTRSANLNPALRDIMSGIEVAFKLHKHPLFDAKGVIVKKFNQLISIYNELVELNKQPFETLNIEQICTNISNVAEILGYNVSPEDVAWELNEETLDSMLTAVSSIIDNVRKEATNPNYDPFAFRGENSIGGYLRTFLTPITEHLEDIAISAFYDSGKMYQSYVIPSYLTKLMKKFKESTDEEFKTFLKEEYGDYEWFRDTSDKKMKASSWKNVWLRQLASMDSKKRKELFGHKVLLNYNGHNYMRNMTSPEYILATFTEFLSGSSTDKEGISTAWYKIPMMSNKPSFEFIKFLRYKGVDYQDTLTTHFHDVFTQELERIQTVLMRNLSESDPEYIKNFDENGKRFMFLEYLNPYLNHLNGELRGTELGKLLNKKLKSESSEEEDNRLSQLVKEVIKTQMNAKADAIIAEYKTNGVFNLAKNIENIGKTDKDVENAIRNFVWNDTFASINILQLTITDTAYYANAEEVQKRLAQIHAPGMRGFVDATDYDGNPVSDGTFRTIFLKDFDKVKSNIIENLEIVFDRKIEQAPEHEKDFWREAKKSIIKQFEDINVADAQAYNSPTSYRKKALMFGKWSRKAEEVYQKLKNKEYNLSDLEIAFQPLKPFVYSQVTKKSGVEGTPIKNMKVNMQFKNSEYLLIMADAILQGEKTGKPNLLRAIYQVMEESAEKYPTQGIDTIQFESAVKVGLQATLDLNQCLEMENGEKVAKALMEAAIYDENTGYYNTTYVHEAPFEDYTIQQEVPAHFKDHEQAQGSQERMIIPSDLARVDVNGETVYYTFTDNGVTKSLTAEEFRKEYESTIAENIKESIDRLYEELGLNIPDKRVRNIALSKILQKEILSSPRYGMDLYIACSVDSNGNFNIPLGDPIQSKRIEQLINSIIKNRINKQKVAGGPVVQVTNYGTSTQLHIKFKNKQGDILPTLTEWLEANPGKTADDFKEFLKENQGGVAYYECYAPAYMQELLQDFMDEKGNLDIEAIEATNPELLDMIGYRIPSEDLYSVAPLRIKGFLPKEAGEGIMLPYEITLITGSDKVAVSTSII